MSKSSDQYHEGKQNGTIAGMQRTCIETRATFRRELDTMIGRMDGLHDKIDRLNVTVSNHMVSLTDRVSKIEGQTSGRSGTIAVVISLIIAAAAVLRLFWK